HPSVTVEQQVGRVEGGSVIGTIVNYFGDDDSEAREWRNKLTLLGQVKAFWVTGILEQAHAEVPPMTLDWDVESEAVEQPWQTVIQTPSSYAGAEDHLQQSIPEFFQAIERSLLILGSPGSGKTLALLEIARSAIHRVERE